MTQLVDTDKHGYECTQTLTHKHPNKLSLSISEYNAMNNNAKT